MNDTTRESQQALAAVERVQRLHAAQRAACFAQPYPSAAERLRWLKALKRQTQRWQDPLAGELAVQCLPGTSGPHALAALGIGGHGEQAVFVIQGRALIVKAQQRRAVDVHG